jgi:quinol monooxygenase YgiN
MIVLTAYVSVLPDKIPDALEACRKVRQPSLDEMGCERYDFFQSPDDPTGIVFVEEWTSKSQLDTHFEQAAFKEFFATLSPYLQRPPDIRIFEATLKV